MARRDEFLKRDTLSLFGDDSRSDCTVAEAKAFEKNQSKRRSRLALFIVVPAVIVVLGAGVGYWLHEKAAMAASIEAEKKKMGFNENTMGMPEAKFVIEIEGMNEENLPLGPYGMLKDMLFTKPSEVRIEGKYGGTEEGPLSYKVVVNGKESIDVVNDAGETVSVNMSDVHPDPALFAKALCQEWNSVYPDALKPMVLKVPEFIDEDAIIEQANEAKSKFENIPLPNDPRMEK